MECHNSGFDLEPGKSVTTGKFTVSYAGELLGVGGHLHDYGRRLVLADLTRKIAKAGVDLDLVYVATQNRVVFGAPDLPALRAALDAAS